MMQAQGEEMYDDDCYEEDEDVKEIWWHNCIDATEPLEYQLKTAKSCVKCLKRLIQMEKEGIIEVLKDASQAMFLTYRILNREEYEKRGGT